MVSLSLTGADTYWFVCMHFVIIMGVSYEAERHYRFLFLNMRAATKMGIDNARLVEKNLTLSLALAEQQVEDKQRELDSKRTIVRQISHEIRTPLNVVAVGLDLVRRQLLQRFSTSLSPPPGGGGGHVGRSWRGQRRHSVHAGNAVQLRGRLLVRTRGHLRFLGV